MEPREWPPAPPPNNGRVRIVRVPIPIRRTPRPKWPTIPPSDKLARRVRERVRRSAGDCGLARRTRLSEYAQRFAENKIDLSVLPHLTDQDLKDIGVPLGHRRKMLAAIAELLSAVQAPPQPGLTEPKLQDTAERRQVTLWRMAKEYQAQAARLGAFPEIGDEPPLWNWGR